MANILLTTYCNRSCEYCFARDKTAVADGAGSENKEWLTHENLDKILAFLHKSGGKTFSGLGGEPTLHPDFEGVIEKVLSQGFDIRLFSNGIMTEDKLEFLKSVDSNKLKFIINMNHPDETPHGEWEKAMQTLKTIPDKVSLGFNIYRKSFEPDFLVDLINEYGLIKNIRLGLAQPIYGEENKLNSYIPIEEYSEIAEKIVALTRKCDANGVTAGFDCGFIMCMFTEAQIGELYYNGCPPNFMCDPIVDIGPSLDVWRCFPLSTQKNLKLGDFERRQDIVDHYNEKTKVLESIGALNDCFGCKHLSRGLCPGGCLSHTLSSFRKRGGLSNAKIAIQ